LFALSASRPTLALAMTKPKKTDSTTTTMSSALARGWEIHFGLPYGSILTREQLQFAHTDKFTLAPQKDGFLDERTLPHGLLYMSVDTALKVCLQTGHPDSNPMVLGWYWDSFTEEELKAGVHSTPEWDEIEDGESLFAEDERWANFPVWNSDIYDRFEDHSRQGYLGLDVRGPAPHYDLHAEIARMKKLALDLADPVMADMQDRDEQQWKLHFGLCRIQQLLSGMSINPIR
jgi:hypothetical protein